MALQMMKYIDVLVPTITNCPYFTVDTSVDYVPVTTTSGHFGVWGTAGLNTKFQNKDNLRIQSIGMFMPENFAFTSPVTPYNDGANQLIGMQLSLSNVHDDALPSNIWLPGYGSTNNGVFVLPFPNYELNLDLFCDIANFQNVFNTGRCPVPGGADTIELDHSTASPIGSAYVGAFVRIIAGKGKGQTRTIITYSGGTYIATVSVGWVDVPDDTSVYEVFMFNDDDYYLYGGFYCPNVSMIGVPSALDGKVMKIVPFVKVAHTCNLVHWTT